MLLVTTALEETWGTDENILFLGEWCKLFHRRNVWEKRSFITCPDPWSDRANRYQASVYTQNFYEKLIPVLTKTLNNYHKINQSERFWRILIGPWLQMFLNTVYHKWETISLASNTYDIHKTVIHTIDLVNLIPTSCKKFEALSHSDIWNHYIIGEVIKAQQNIYVEYKNNEFPNSEPIITSVHKRSTIKLLNKFLQFLNKFESQRRNLLLNIYLDRISQIKLSLLIKQIPTLSIVPDVIPIAMERAQREYFKIDANFQNKFEQFFIQFLEINIPTSYLEGFTALSRLSQNSTWPKYPKMICTANNHWMDDVFKCYTSTKVDQGSVFKIICHGGGGKFLYSDFQQHELSICDNYFTWGWKEYSEKCFKGFLIKTQGKKIERSNPKHITLITYSDFRYTSILASMPSYEQFINVYLQNQITFIKELKQNIRKETLVRLHYDLENSIKDRMLQQVNDLNFSYIESDLYKVLKSTKLVIGTYNCTTIVESISLNIPTIIFWEAIHWELVASAIPFFEKLKRCGIFHDSPESAANQVNAIWGCVEDWWNSADVQEAKNEFKAWFGRDSQNPLKDMIHFFNSTHESNIK